MLSKVDLPHPDAPTMHTISPSPTVRSMPSMARTVLPASGREVLHDVLHQQLRAHVGRRRRALMIVPRAQRGCASHRSARSLAIPITAKIIRIGEHAIDLTEPLGLHEAIAEPVLGREQLGDHQHEPRRGEVDAGDVDDAGPRVGEDHACATRGLVRHRACTTR